MATRTRGEPTSSGCSETGGICRNNTFHQSTYATSSQLYHPKQQYKDPTVAWRRIIRHTDSDKVGSAAGSTSAHAKDMESNTFSRNRGRPLDNKINVANQKPS